MTHTNDVGMFIHDAVYHDEDLTDIELLDWEQDWPPDHPTGEKVQFHVDLSDGFDNLIIETSDGCKFRVSITRID